MPILATQPLDLFDLIFSTLPTSRLKLLSKFRSVSSNVDPIVRSFHWVGTGFPFNLALLPFGTSFGSWSLFIFWRLHSST